MALLRRAATDGIKLYLTEDQSEWIEVRQEISKKERNALIKKMPARPDIQKTGMTPSEGVEFQTDLFEVLGLSWSADMPFTREEYLALPPEAADAVDQALANHFEAMIPSKEEQGKD
jgi:hypothetical protein